MIIQEKVKSPFSCNGCIDEKGLDFEFTMAFQPIVDVEKEEIFAHEALVRGLENQSAASILAQVNDHNRYRFRSKLSRKSDQTSRLNLI